MWRIICRIPITLRWGDAALEQVLMDLISRHGVEVVPDKLTVHRMQELFAHSTIRTEAIDLSTDLGWRGGSKPPSVAKRRFAFADRGWIKSAV